MWRHHQWRMLHARSALSAEPADLYHLLDGSMAFFVPSFIRPKTCATVHDLVPLMQARGDFPGRPSFLATQLIRRSAAALHDFAALCAVSRNTLADVVRLTGYERAISIIPNIARSLPGPEPVPGFACPARYIFHVGNNTCYKNRIGVINVFSRLCDVDDLHLVMAGSPPTQEMRTLASRDTKRIHFLGSITDAQLHGFYRGAALFLFPSRYEGFGMPVLEAMRAGCPVVCSTNGALDEIAGDGALKAPADDLDGLAVYCRSLLGDGELRRRQIAKGRARAEAFNLAAMGRSLVDWYRTVVR